MPKISIIIPVYNTEKYLPKCLDSVCNQTLSDIEIICINDCSTDRSFEVLNDFAAKDKRIRIINLSKNEGVSTARNIGIESAKGEYIGFMDSDDFVDLDFYEKLYNKAIETNADSVKGNIYDYEASSGYIHLSKFYDMNESVRKHKANFLYAFTSAIYKTALIKDNKIHFPENLKYFEDPYFSIKAALYYDKVATADDAKYYYVKRENSACSSSDENFQIKSTVNGIRLITDILNSHTPDIEHYKIVMDFLVSKLTDRFYSNCIGKTDIFKGLLYLIKNDKYRLDSIFETALQDMTNKLENQYNTLDKYFDFLKENYTFQLQNKNNEKIYLVSVVNNYKLYDKLIKNNIFVKSSSNIELKDFDNTKDNIFIPIRYNYFLDNYDYSKEAWFIFCHCDWEPMEDIGVKLEGLDKGNIYGTIGKKVSTSNGKVIRETTGFCYERRRDGSSFRELGNYKKNIEISDTFDCQAIIVHSSLIQKYNLRFDKNLKWDLYTEDFSISALKNYGIKSYAISLAACHWSGYHSYTPPSYYEALNYLNNKYPDDLFGGTVSYIGGKPYQEMNTKEILFHNLRKNIKNTSIK